MPSDVGRRLRPAQTGPDFFGAMPLVWACPFEFQINGRIKGLAQRGGSTATAGQSHRLTSDGEAGLSGVNNF